MRHAATAANLAHPPLLQGRRSDPPLAPAGLVQAQATRDLLAGLPLRRCYSSPLLRAVQTAGIVAEPHGLAPVALLALTECDIGAWEGLSWQDVCDRDPEGYAHFHADPSAFGYPGGESFADVHARVAPAFSDLLDRHAGEAVLVVAHHTVVRIYLAALLGLPLARARQVSLANASLSVVTCQGRLTRVEALNHVGHLAGL